MKIITVKILKKKGIQIRLEKLLQIEDEAEFKLQTGVKRLVFFQMLDILTKEFDKKHIKGSFKGIGQVVNQFLPYPIGENIGQ